MSTEASCILGVDPGLTGAMALLDVEYGQVVSVTDMPRVLRGTKSDLDFYEVGKIIGQKASYIRFAVVEDVTSMPNQGVVSTFTFGRVSGIILGVLGAYGIPIFFAKPSIWKPALKLTKDKKLSLKKAIEFYPHIAPALSRAKDNGRAEAILLAHFGKRFWDDRA